MYELLLLSTKIALIVPFKGRWLRRHSQAARISYQGITLYANLPTMLSKSINSCQYFNNI
jgi:hypothetical protein